MTYKQKYDLAHEKDYSRNRIIRGLVMGFLGTLFCLSFAAIICSIVIYNATGETGTKMFIASVVCTFVTSVLNCIAHEVLYGGDDC